MPYQSYGLKAFHQNLLADGCDLTIYKDSNTPDVISIKGRAILRSDTLFEFPVDSNIEKNDVVQLDGSNVYWKVTETEEEKELGAVVNINAIVEFIG